MAKENKADTSGDWALATALVVAIGLLFTGVWWMSVGAERSEYKYCLKQLGGGDYQAKVRCYDNTF